MDPSSAGVVQILAVTVRQFKISSGVCGRFKPQVGPLLQFWKMDPSSAGVVQILAVTVRQFNFSSCLLCLSKCKGMARPELPQESSWLEFPFGLVGG